MDTDNASFVGPYRCLRCDSVIGYLLELGGKTVLRLYDEKAYRQFAYRATVECGRCGERREFAS